MPSPMILRWRSSPSSAPGSAGVSGSVGVPGSAGVSGCASAASSAPGAPPWPRPSAAFLALAGLVVAGSLAVRFALVGRQSYWIDELFSVSEVDRPWRAMLSVGATEVHTPLYASLLWVWARIGGSGEAWTRTLSTLCAVASVAVAHRGLRGLGLSDELRWALTVATAASGTSIVYSLETRSYALLMLGSIGLTVATLRAALLILDGGQPSPRGLAAWTGWSALAATAHLFGAVLTVGALAVLGAVTLVRAPHRKLRGLLTWAVLAGIGCSLQAAWLIHGFGRPGFAGGTSWIPVPGRQALEDLATTTFSSGGLVAHKDGFAWTSRAGIGITVVVLAAAFVLRFLVRFRPGRRWWPATSTGVGADVVSSDADGRAAPAAAVLLSLAVVVILATFGGSQWLRLWTLRNMVIIAPALLWGVICLLAAVAGPVVGTRRVAVVVVLLLGLGLGPIATGLAHPYKTDFRGLFAYLATVRRSDPGASFVFVGHGPPLGWGPVSDPPAGTATGGNRRLDLGLRSVSSAKAVVRTPGTEVIVLYRGVDDRYPQRAAAQLVARLGGDSCRIVPLSGLGLVRCG